jgi:hypothetical protein
MAFTALYEGRCDDCLEAIRPGDRIVRKPGGYAHEVCDVTPGDFELKPGETVCGTCFLIHPEGKCDA